MSWDIGFNSDTKSSPIVQSMSVGLDIQGADDGSDVLISHTMDVTLLTSVKGITDIYPYESSSVYDVEKLYSLNVKFSGMTEFAAVSINAPFLNGVQYPFNRLDDGFYQANANGSELYQNIITYRAQTSYSAQDWDSYSTLVSIKPSAYENSGAGINNNLVQFTKQSDLQTNSSDEEQVRTIFDISTNRPICKPTEVQFASPSDSDDLESTLVYVTTGKFAELRIPQLSGSDKSYKWRLMGQRLSLQGGIGSGMYLLENSRRAITDFKAFSWTEA